MKLIKQFTSALFICGLILMLFSCNPSGNQQTQTIISDTTEVLQQDTITNNNEASSDSTSKGKQQGNIISENKSAGPKVLVYNFHGARRCPSCIAIEEATGKTLKTYFSKELRSGRIKQRSINVEEEANFKIAEKYEASGSALFVTRVYQGKEIIVDLTGDGFKYAKNKEDKFIEILKNKINDLLK